MTAMTAADHRAKAQQHFTNEQESFERCDTDGFLSQWASGLNGRLELLRANLAENNNEAEFEALFTTDGNLVPARLIETKYGMKWAVYADDEAALNRGEITGWVIPVYTERGAKALAKKGYRVGKVLAKAKAELVGRSATSVAPQVIRTDGGYDPAGLFCGWQWYHG